MAYIEEERRREAAGFFARLGIGSISVVRRRLVKGFDGRVGLECQ